MIEHPNIGAGGGDEEGYIHPDVLAMQSSEFQHTHARRLLEPLLEIMARRAKEQRTTIGVLEHQIAENLIGAWTALNADVREAATLHLAQAFRYSGMLAILSGGEGWHVARFGVHDPVGWPEGCSAVVKELLRRLNDDAA